MRKAWKRGLKSPRFFFLLAVIKPPDMQAEDGIKKFSFLCVKKEKRVYKYPYSIFYTKFDED